MTTLEGAVVVITGAGRGIGRATALELGQGGARVVVNYAHSKESAEELVLWLKEHGSQESVAIQSDVSDPT
ncbi:MAG TPA: SDR family NAD(P)-dependent oxidoreductase, partial [Ktedonobacteraceae bacterium]|nr:SDR family NAD(P)-dependent oxidoreductase [Ktedonobacteraceae bacterium]